MHSAHASHHSLFARPSAHWSQPGLDAASSKPNATGRCGADRTPPASQLRQSAARMERRRKTSSGRSRSRARGSSSPIVWGDRLVSPERRACEHSVAAGSHNPARRRQPTRASPVRGLRHRSPHRKNALGKSRARGDAARSARIPDNGTWASSSGGHRRRTRDRVLRIGKGCTPTT